ncbi:MAG: 5'-3' exonuclease H3TH domain-containing protein [Solirubrobacteraceae bacterium]
MAGPLLAVDTPYLLFRAAFSLPESITDGEGRPVNALLGTANALLQVVEERAPRAVVLCFGEEAADYRVALYPAYHAHREPMPDPLARQFDDAPEFFAAFGWPSLSEPGLEADDVLGALAAAETAAGGETLLMTGDRDMFQCVGDRVTVLYAAQSKGGPAVIDADEVRQRYGVGPELVPDFIALRGDPSDGLPGGKGIGEKTAADLLRRHGSLEGAIANALTEPPRVRGSLREQADELRAFKEIATLRPVHVERPPDQALDRAGAAAAARARGMNRLAARLDPDG